MMMSFGGLSAAVYFLGSDMSQLALYFFGAPRLELDGEAVLLSHHKALALLAYLAVTRQRHTRQALAALLWPDYEPAAGRGEVRRMLWVLNKSLGQRWLEVDRDTVLLPSQPNLWLDIDRFRELLAMGQQHGHSSNRGCPACLDPLTEAVTLAQNDFLAGFTLPDSPDFDTWQTFETEGLRRELAGALERLVQLLIEQGEISGEQAISYARRWLALDPLHEPAHRQLMQLYAWAGQPAAALHQYQTCCQLLERELGVLPAAETTALAETIKANRLPLPAAALSRSPLASEPARPPHNLPLQATPFIGREATLDGLQQRLSDPDVRLITIVGPGGIGKTRLALALAEQQLQPASLFTHGVYFISLAPIRSADAIAHTIAEGLACPLSSAEEPAIQLLTYLRHKQMLLILDNFEHVLGGAALVSQILQTAPGVKVLVTSWERLNLTNEILWPISGLNFAELVDVKEALTHEAVQLFVQTARHVRPDFGLRVEDLPHLKHILQVVWGMPLAIELAAAWSNVLSLAEIAAELSHGLDLLESELRDIPDRHRSMRLVFGWSWERLKAEEQALFKALSVFRGGFTREAAQQITGASLRLLAGLVNKSLVTSQSNIGRYELHELLRQYAALRLQEQPDEERAWRDRHSHYYLTLLQTREADLRSQRQKDTLAELNADIDNIRTAWDIALTCKQINLLHNTTEPLYYFYELHQYFQEAVAIFSCGAEVVRTRLAALENNDPTPERVKLEEALGDMLNYQAFFNLRQGNNREALRLYQTSLSLLQPLGETYALAFALVHYGIVCWAAGDFEAGSRYMHEGLTLSRALGHTYLQSLAAGLLGGLTHDKGDYAEAYRWLSEAMALCRTIGDPYHTLFIGIYFSRTAQALGRLTEAQELLREGLQIAQEAGNRWGIGLALERLAMVAQAAGDDAEARRLIEQSVALQREVGDRWSLSWALNALSRLALAHQELAQAEQWALEALKTAVEADYNTGALDVLATLAEIYQQQGLNAAALELALHILHQPASTQDAKDRAEKLRAALMAQFTPQQLETVQARLQAHSFEVAVKEIVDTVVTP